MSQHDGTIANQQGAAFRADINDLFEALLTLMGAPTAPTTTYAHMWWADETAGILKRRDTANGAWIDVMPFTTSISAFGATLVNAANAAAAQAVLGVGSLPTGTVISYDGSTLPSGWIYSSGRTIGNAASGATERANADTATLFAMYWNSMTNTEAPVSGGRGASAAADYAANKTIAVPDRRGRTDIGRDDMGGTAANRVTSGVFGVAGTLLGGAGGAQSVTLTSAEMPVHAHTVNDPTHSHSVGGSMLLYGQFTNISAVLTQSGSIGTTAASTGISLNNAGSGGAHTNMQPSVITNKLIRL